MQAPKPKVDSLETVTRDLAQCNQVVQFKVMLQSLASIVFDPRRSHCHTLNFNYFVASGGFDILLRTSASIIRLASDESLTPEGQGLAFLSHTNSPFGSSLLHNILSSFYGPPDIICIWRTSA